MKRNTNILLKTTSLVLAFVLLLGAGIMSLTFSHSGVKPNDSNFLTPDLAVKAPTSQELLQKKFNAYNTVTEENGKSVVTIFSEEQIKDFNDRRNNGEWFSLSAEEALFLVNDTKILFEKYDIIRIRSIEGTVATYFSENNTSQNYTDALFDRITVFNPNLAYTIENIKIVAFDVDSNANEVSLRVLSETIGSVFTYAPTSNFDYYYSSLNSFSTIKNCSVLVFYYDSIWYKNGIYYLQNVANANVYNLESYRINLE